MSRLPMLRRHALALVLCGVWATAAAAAGDSVSTKTYQELTEAQELMGEDRLDDALVLLREHATVVKADTLDEALTLQMLGYAEMAAERFEVAIGHLKRSLALDKLPETVKYNVGYMVAQLHAALGEFEEALTFAAEWFETLAEPTPTQTMFLANIYAQTKRYAEAIPYAERAVAATDRPRESWFQLLTAANFELERYGGTARTLRRMIELWPDNASYWEQLAGVYVLLEREDQALATLRVAWLERLLEKENSIKSMVQLAVARGVPEHAGRLLERALEEELLPRDEDYVDLLANAWVAAREYEPAVAAFTELAALEGGGEPLLRVANLHMDKGRWAAAEAALRSALEGDLEAPGKAWLLLGITLAEQEKFEAGFEALRKAQAFADTRRQAGRWLGYARDMRKQHEWRTRVARG